MTTAKKKTPKKTTKTKATGPLTVHVVLDRSGSMETVRDDTIGAFNSYVETVAKSSPTSRLSLTIFDSQSIDTIISDQPIKEVKKLDRATYIPRAATPLYDAVGNVVAKLDAAKGKAKALVILTDGQENSSREYQRDTVKALLDDRQNNKGWLVIYLGANQDAFAEGGAIGTQRGTTMTYNPARTQDTMAAAAAATTRYAFAGGGAEGRLKAVFTNRERALAAGEEDDDS